MTPREALAQIRIDCKRDVENMDGKPLTGANVAQWFGETLAMIDALAGIVDLLYAHSPKDPPDRSDLKFGVR